MEPLATRAELAAWMQIPVASLPSDTATLVLEMATAAVFGAAPWLDGLDPPPSVAKGVCLQAAARVVGNPDQASQLRDGERAMTVASVGFALLPHEIEQLTDAAPDGVLGVAPQAPTGSWPDAPLVRW
jgi:hypothetical protein